MLWYHFSENLLYVKHVILWVTWKVTKSQIHTHTHTHTRYFSYLGVRAWLHFWCLTIDLLTKAFRLPLFLSPPIHIWYFLLYFLYIKKLVTGGKFEYCSPCLGWNHRPAPLTSHQKGPTLSLLFAYAFPPGLAPTFLSPEVPCVNNKRSFKFFAARSCISLRIQSIN